MKKRLFLSSAIMTAVLAGALTTGTFAWYQATSNAGLTKSAVDNISTISTATYGELGSQTVTVTLTRTDSVNMVLSKAGETSVETSAWINNAEVADLNSSGKLIGTYTITASWADVDDQTEGLQEPADDIKAALTNKQFTATLKAKGNVVLLSSNTRTNNSNEIDGDVTVTVTWDGSAFVITADKSALTNVSGTMTGYFAVQTNNDGGQEYIHSEEVKVQKENADAGVPTDATADRLFPVGTPVNQHESDALNEYQYYHSHDGIDLE